MILTFNGVATSIGKVVDSVVLMGSTFSSRRSLSLAPPKLKKLINSLSLYSFLIVMLLTALVAMILARALRRDIQRYNAEDIEDAKEEFGWKVSHFFLFCLL